MKRIFDIIVALLFLVLLSWLIALLTLLILIMLGRPILFVQARPGLYGKRFKLYKFRSMLNNVNKADELLTDEHRVTKFGSWLRRMSFDELPSLWNVVRGDMSLVGPRPLLVEYLDLYTPEQMRRHNVLPGITGWAQVNGRNELSWDEKFKKDLWYVDNHNFWLDMRILFLTVASVIKSQGITQVGHVTSEKFRGSK